MSKKEGWLIKQNKKRYFVLSEDDTLTWFSQPLGKAKGGLDLQDYYLEVKKGDEGKNLLQLQPKQSEKKTYQLQSKDPEELESWAKALENAIKYLSLKPEKKKNEKAGWLEKKGKKRWFLLKNEVLYWFNKEQFINADIKKLCNKSLEMFNCHVTEGPDTKAKPFSFTIASDNGDNYTLTAKSDQERKQWIQAIERAIQEGKNNLKEKKDILSQEESVLLKKGFLQKKGKKRFFVLNGVNLSWFLSEKEDVKKGNLMLCGCKVELVNGKRNTFLINNPNGKSYELTAEMGQELEEWMTLLVRASSTSRERNNSAQNVLKYFEKTKKEFDSLKLKHGNIHKGGWLMKKGKRRYFILSRDILMWFVDEQPTEPNYNAIRGNLILAGCIVENAFHEFSFTIKTPNERVFTLTANTVNEANEWIQYLQSAISFANEVASSFSSDIILDSEDCTKSGWMSKKGKIRWFVLKDDILLWYEDDNSVKPKNSLPLFGCSLHVASKNSFVLASPGRNNYTLTVENVVEQKQWVETIQEAIFKCNRILTSEMEMKGWLEKKGQKRWFVIRQGILMWFSQEQSVDQATPEKANNKINLNDYAIEPYCGNHNITLTSNDEKKKAYVLKANSDEQAEAWIRALVSSKRKKGKKGKVFGKPLNELEMNEHSLPVFFHHAVDFLKEHGCKTEGIFRVSVKQDRLERLRKSIDQGEKVTFSNNQDDIQAAASLLKDFLNELPHPLINSDIARDLMEVDNDEKAKALIQSLPNINKNVLSGLFLLFQSLVKEVENKIDADNIALLFGSALFSHEHVPLTKMKQIIHLLIDHYATIFVSQIIL